MKFHIVILALFLSVCGCYSQPQQKSEKWDQGVLVWSRGTRLEALQAGQKKPIVLRGKFSGVSSWHISRDGRQMTFAEAPRDVDFFNASAYRSYLFTVGSNTRPKVLIAAYGPKALKSGENYDYQTPSFDRTGRKIVVNEGEIGQFMESSSHRWVAIYDVKTRRRVFDSRQLIAKMAEGETRDALRKLKFEFPALSPDGQNLVCLATQDDGDTMEDYVAPGQKAPPTLVVHFNTAVGTGGILAAIDDQLSLTRLIYRDKEQSDIRIEPTRNWNPQFAWHPTQKKFLFVGPAAPSDPALNLFAFDFQTRQIKRLTRGSYFEASPQWTLDGKSLVWLRRPMSSRTPESNRIFRATANGGNIRAILPQIRGATQIQIVPQIANWTRFQKLPAEALAGADK